MIFIATFAGKSVLYCYCQWITFGCNVIDQSLCCLVSLVFFPIALHAVKSVKQHSSVQKFLCFSVCLPDNGLDSGPWGAFLHRKWLTTYCLFFLFLVLSQIFDALRAFIFPPIWVARLW